RTEEGRGGTMTANPKTYVEMARPIRPAAMDASASGKHRRSGRALEASSVSLKSFIFFANVHFERPHVRRAGSYSIADRANPRVMIRERIELFSPDSLSSSLRGDRASRKTSMPSAGIF